MKSRFLIAIALAFAIALPSAPVSAGAIPANSAIKGESHSAVYWYATDGKRYVFPTEGTFYSWFPNFNNVITIPDSTLASITIGGNVTYRPGSKMLKITTDPRTYVVTRGGNLRLVNSESIASGLYGYNWASQIHDLPDAFFVNYKLGSPITNLGDVNLSNEYNGVSNPSDSIFYNGSTPAPSPTPSVPPSVILNTNKTYINEGDAVVLTGNLFSAPTYEYRMEIVDVRTGFIVRTCTNFAPCETTVNPYRTTNGQNNVQYYVVLKRTSDNNEITRQYSSVIYFNGTGSNFSSGSSLLTVNKSTVNYGESLQLIGSMSNITTPDNQLRIEFYRERDNALLYTCYDARTCTYNLNVYEDSTSVRYYILAKNDANETIPAAYSSRVSVTNVPTTPSGTLTTNVNKTSINAGESVSFTAQYANAPVSTYYKTEIMDQYGNVKTTCIQTAYCYHTATVTSTINNIPVTYQAVIKNSAGTIIASKAFPTITVNQVTSPSTITGTATIAITPTGTRPANSQITITGTVTNSNVATNALTMHIWAGTTPQVIKTCTDVTTCSTNYTLGAAGNSIPFYISVIGDNSTNALLSSTQWVNTN